MKFCETGMNNTISNHGLLIIVFIVCSILDKLLAVKGFVCGIINFFLAICSFSQHSQPVFGSAVAVNGQCWTTLIESGCMPDLAPCHISTEQRTLSQVQILAAGHFLAKGISCPSQTNTHVVEDTHTQTGLRHTHIVTQTHMSAKLCKQKGQMRQT